ncbi:MAG: sensor histidine kinase [Clostridia bacterium]|nr:sensor histidine kinase [Clostridia bacterium]
MDEVTYYGNGSLICHIWSNLLSNAIKFSPDYGKITIVLKRREGGIYFSVADEGEGVKEEEIKHIFNKFYQSDTSRKQEGNGLGLAIVKKITDTYGGEVSVENALPRGCKFTVRLPET